MSTNLSPEPAPTDSKKGRGVIIALVILAALVVLALLVFALSGSSDTRPNPVTGMMKPAASTRAPGGAEQAAQGHRGQGAETQAERGNHRFTTAVAG